MEFEYTVYEWVKVVHVLSVISWMAGLLYFPRLLVYHSESMAAGKPVDVFLVMERRLLRAIMHPAMIVTWCSGALLGYLGGFFLEWWFVGKVVFVFAMTVFHFSLARHRLRIECGGMLWSPKRYRVINEIPTVLMIGIVVFVIVKPF